MKGLSVMPSFDSKFNELQIKITAVLQMLIDEFPDAAVRAKQIIAGYEEVAAIQETIQADEARGNAVAALITGAGQLLAAVPDPEPVFEPEPEPTPDPEPETSPEGASGGTGSTESESGTGGSGGDGTGGTGG